MAASRIRSSSGSEATGLQKEIQAMQSALSTDCVYNVVNIFLGKARSKAVTFENGLVLQYHGDRHIGSPTAIT
jgi:hypothetical protein